MDAIWRDNELPVFVKLPWIKKTKHRTTLIGIGVDNLLFLLNDANNMLGPIWTLTSRLIRVDIRKTELKPNKWNPHIKIGITQTISHLSYK